MREQGMERVTLVRVASDMAESKRRQENEQARLERCVAVVVPGLILGLKRLLLFSHSHRLPSPPLAHWESSQRFPLTACTYSMRPGYEQSSAAARGAGKNGGHV